MPPIDKEASRDCPTNSKTQCQHSSYGHECKRHPRSYGRVSIS
ncbi:hypothetical protein [Pseudomonas sp. McL0111]